MKKILINNNPWQIRIAITRDGGLQNVFFAAHAKKTLERTFFKGSVYKVLPGIQTAFVDIGQERAGFLHISEIDRELAIERISKQTQMDTDRRPRSRQRLDIAKIFKEGEPVLVQVSKEPVYEKGAKLTTCFTLPGRFLVLMPNIPRIGVSKKIDDREERAYLKETLDKYLPEGMGAIIRTTAEGYDEYSIEKDLNYLVRTWKTIQDNFASAKPQEKVYEDIPLSMQIIRDHLDEDVESVIIDDKEKHKDVYGFVKNIAPEFSHVIKHYKGQTPIFDYYNITKQISAALEKKALLKSGGSLIIESAEAMTVVDVNTGKFTGRGNLEETIFKTNMEAAEEVVRQLRLRNIGGLIVIDFIDMQISSNRRKLFQHFEKMLKERDRFQSVVLKLSEFGLVQMTRKRSGKTLVQELTNNCQTCSGSGFIKSVQTQAYSLLRELKLILGKQKPKKVTLTANPAIFSYLTDTEYNSILDLEKQFSCKITLADDKRLDLSQYNIDKK